MPEINPYQPPQTPEPLTRAQAIKRGIGVGAVLLLTPLAVFISVAAGCTAQRFLPSLAHPLRSIILDYSVIGGIPLLTLVGMMIWAIVADQRRGGDPARRKARTWWLLLTPVVVAGATALGIGLAILVVDVTSRNAGGVTTTGIMVGLALFALTPTIALFAMLAIAWRAGR
jgi:hypothetical protein